MNTKRNLYLTIGVLLLVCVNIALVVMLIKGKGGHDGMPPGGPYKFMEDELQMTDQQKKQYGTLREEHHLTMDTLREQMKRLHTALYANPNAAPAQTDSIINLIGQAQAQNQRLTYNHFMKIRAFCTPEQQKKFDKIIGEMLERMIPKPPPKEENK